LIYYFFLRTRSGRLRVAGGFLDRRRSPPPASASPASFSGSVVAPPGIAAAAPLGDSRPSSSTGHDSSANTGKTNARTACTGSPKPAPTPAAPGRAGNWTSSRRCATTTASNIAQMNDTRRSESTLRPPPLNLAYRLLDLESGGHFSTWGGRLRRHKGGVLNRRSQRGSFHVDTGRARRAPHAGMPCLLVQQEGSTHEWPRRTCM
jgi:hypothetical protein